MNPSDSLSSYAGRELSPQVVSLLDLLQRHGFRAVVTGGANKTVRIHRAQRNVGYVNSTVLQRHGVLGYHFATHGRAADACPEDLVSNVIESFVTQYGIAAEALDLQRAARHTYLIIRDPTAALKVLLQDAGFALPEDTQVVLTNEKYVEGRIYDVTMRHRERSREARAACLAAYGFSCYVCGLNLRAQYVGLATEVIHVHHEEPLAGAPREREFDPVATMKPVCPNCHAVIHAREPPYSITEVKAMVGA
jgi:hypothetical protein